MRLWNLIKKGSYNPTISTIAGGAVGAIAGEFVTLMISFIATDIKYHDVVTYNNITSYINDLMVAPGLVEEDILSLENPFEQIELIASTMSK